MDLNETEKERLLKISKRILLCIVRNRAESIEVIRLDTSLNYDLGLEGDDVDDLLNDIQKYVSIDWSALNFGTYFYSEGALPFQSLSFILFLPFTLLFLSAKKLLKWFGLDASDRWKIRFFRKNKKPFPVGALIAAGYFGKWKNSNFEHLSIEQELYAWQKEFQFRFQRRYKRKV
ncbi:DUF1493 family protein [Leptospira barantonii]|uniref:DUF1493 family protein n=1 Tax=Leptospira barantonii TaxID=2023184 RepID=A0ABX4NLR2_9LEPT|nr:DUF1493 family protein [Leptospira barantonii]PJZ57782.1 hypothetical protein CH367_05120 [Leptospira barantonii]